MAKRFVERRRGLEGLTEMKILAGDFITHFERRLSVTSRDVAFTIGHLNLNVFNCMSLFTRASIGLDTIQCSTFVSLHGRTLLCRCDTYTNILFTVLDTVGRPKIRAIEHRLSHSPP